MAITLSSRPGAASRPVRAIFADGIDRLPDQQRKWAAVMRFSGEAGSVLIVPGKDGEASAADAAGVYEGLVKVAAGIK